MTSGILPAPDLAQAARAQAQAQLDHCAELANRQGGEPAVTFSLLIRFDGAVVEDSRPSFNDEGGTSEASLRACVVSAFKGVRFQMRPGFSSGTGAFTVSARFRRTREVYDRAEMQAWADTINVPCQKKPPRQGP